MKTLIDGNEVDLLILDLDGTCYDYEMADRMAYESLREEACHLLQTGPENFDYAYQSAKSEVKSRLYNVAASHSRLLYLKTLLTNFGSSNIVADALDLSNLYWNEFLSGMRPRKGLHKFLTLLKKNGVRVVILTNLTTEIQIKKLIELQIEHLISGLITSEEVGAEKPNPSAFTRVLELNESCSHPLVVGDDFENDIKPAKALGLNALQLPNIEAKPPLTSFASLLKKVEVLP